MNKLFIKKVIVGQVCPTDRPKVVQVTNNFHHPLFVGEGRISS